MAPTLGSLSAFSHKTAVRVGLCARPHPFLKAFEEREECAEDARALSSRARLASSAWRAPHPAPRMPSAPTASQAPPPTCASLSPTVSCVTAPTVRAPGTHRARPGNYRLSRPAPTVRAPGT